MKVESGIVVLSYGWKYVDGVMKSIYFSLATKTDGTILTMQINVSMSSMERSHWITDQ